MWTNRVLPPAQPTTPAGYHQAITPTRILDTWTASGLTHTSHNITAGTSTVPGGSVIQLQLTGDTVTPAASGGSTKVPTTVTAVSIDVTATNETDHGFVAVYADGAQPPLTSPTNFSAEENTTGHQIVPVGGDGKIDLYTHGNTTDTTALIVDPTGYFTSNSTAVGDQTYTPLNTPARALDTRSSIAHTSGLVGTGTVPADKAFTLKISGTTVGNTAVSVPANATAVALNLTAADETGGGHLAAYATDASPSTLTSLSYNSDSSIASMSADVPIAADGTITIANYTVATAVAVGISGYYTTGTTGQKYHSVNATRMVGTRSGVGNVSITPVSGATAQTYTLPADTQQITVMPNPTLTTMITATDTTSGGYAAAFATGSPNPTSTSPFSDLNWGSGDTRANLALPRQHRRDDRI